MKKKQLFTYAAMLCIGAGMLTGCGKKQEGQQQQQQTPELAVMKIGRAHV